MMRNANAFAKCNMHLDIISHQSFGDQALKVVIVDKYLQPEEIPLQGR